MSHDFSYTGDPSKSDLDAVRFTLGDTDADCPLLLDAEINFLVTNEGDARSAAAAGARSIAAKFARQADEKVGDISVKFSQKSKQYFELADKLEDEVGTFLGKPIATGISISKKRINVLDDDLVEPAFTRGVHEHPGARTRDFDDDPRRDC